MRYLLLLVSGFPLFAAAQLQVAGIFTDNMVLQQGQPVRIWGRAVPGDQVTVNFAGQEQKVMVKKDSSWKVVFGKQPASAVPQTVTITCNQDKIEIGNILVGDSWLCIGQSNMEFPMRQELHFREEALKADHPLLRFYNPGFTGKNLFGMAYTDSMFRRLTKEQFYSTTNWQVCDSNTLKDMTAVGYYFGKTIMQQVHVPVGLIHLAIGGSPIETFISKKTLQQNTSFSAKVKGNWLTNEALPVWVKERGNQNVGAMAGTDEEGPNHGFKPGFAWAAGIEPLLELPIKGIIWYQGESNAQELPRVKEYAALQKLMVQDYRAKWQQPNMPFYWVQLSSIDSVTYRSQLWPLFRDEQRKLLDMIPGGGMAVCSDIGHVNNVHPTNKKAVGERLARWALNKTYHQTIIPSGPLPLRAVYEKGKVIVRFQYAGTGLQTSDALPLRGFSLDGKKEVNALIRGQTVELEVRAKPAFIYYGWKPYTDANLVNAEQLPASTFKMMVQ